jgi:predicted nucleic acid-binding protein
VIRSDQYHERAIAERDLLEQQRLDPIVPYPVLIEAHRLLLRRISPDRAHDWLDQIAVRSALFTPTEDDFAEALRRIHRYWDQPLTITDCLLAVLSDRLSLPVWTFDHHFDILRVPRWPQGV